MCDGLEAIGRELGVPLVTCRAGAMFGFYFHDRLPQNLEEAAEANIELFKRFFHACLKRGVYFAPSAYEAGFISSAHTPELIDQTLVVAREALLEARG